MRITKFQIAAILGSHGFAPWSPNNKSGWLMHEANSIWQVRIKTPDKAAIVACLIEQGFRTQYVQEADEVWVAADQTEVLAAKEKR